MRVTGFYSPTGRLAGVACASKFVHTTRNTDHTRGTGRSLLSGRAEELNEGYCSYLWLRTLARKDELDKSVGKTCHSSSVPRSSHIHVSRANDNSQLLAHVQCPACVSRFCLSLWPTIAGDLHRAQRFGLVDSGSTAAQLFGFERESVAHKFRHGKIHVPPFSDQKSRGGGYDFGPVSCAPG